MKAKDFIPASKPRNFVAKNATTSGAGAHKDKKKAEKQGDVKHKAKQFEQGVAEGISVIDQDYDLDQVVLTLDIEGKKAEFTYTDYDENFENTERKDVFDQLQEKSWYKGLDHPTKMEILDAAYKAIRGEEPSEYKPTVDDEPMERIRDPEDWDEGNTEPPNNFAVYINGKKWKVFKGRGQFADDYKEIQHYRQLQNWAQAKSQATGKKWTVSITGEPATE
jgi:hypothetical protein